MSFIDSIKDKFRKHNYRHIVITREILPRFSNRYNTQNRTYELVNIVEAKYKKMDGTSVYPIETQNGKAIEVHKKKVSKSNGDDNFEKNGIVKDQVYKLSGFGYMGNIDFIGIVTLVTDKHVYISNVDAVSRGTCYTHEEIEKIKDFNSLEKLQLA